MGLKAVLHGLGKISHPDPMILKQRAPRKSPLLINFEKKIKKDVGVFHARRADKEESLCCFIRSIIVAK
jgi:hypothetical protein